MTDRVPDFEDRRWGEFPEALVRGLNYQATTAINHFTVSFVLGKNQMGSGTLVDAYGERGILTAFHVVEEFDRHLDLPIFMIISRKVYRFNLPRECFEHVPLGTPKDEKRPELGPDLSFLKLAPATHQVSTLEAIKSFYRIRDNPLDVHDGLSIADIPFEKLSWWLAGAPAERGKRRIMEDSGKQLLQAAHMVGRAEYKGLESDNGFDRLTIKIPESVDLYPGDYGGCSGGGIWTTGMFKDKPSEPDESIEVFPLLMGIAYVQFEARDGYIEIVANGPKSLASLKKIPGGPGR